MRCRAADGPIIAESLTDPARRQQIIIFDPATSALLEERTVSLAPYWDTRAPFLWGYATYLETEIVPELPAE